MAEYRTIKMSMWDDPFIEDLEALEKLLYIYLITSRRTSNLGVLEISRKRISINTGMTVDQVESGLETLKKSGKLVEADGMLWLVNFIANQTSTSELILKGLNSLFQKIDSKDLQERMYEKYPDIFKGYADMLNPIDTPSNPIDTPSKGIRSHDDLEIPLLKDEVEVEVEVEVEKEDKEEFEFGSGIGSGIPKWEKPSGQTPFNISLQTTLLKQNLLEEKTLNQALRLAGLCCETDTLETVRIFSEENKTAEQFIAAIEGEISKLKKEVVTVENTDQ